MVSQSDASSMTTYDVEGLGMNCSRTEYTLSLTDHSAVAMRSKSIGMILAFYNSQDIS